MASSSGFGRRKMEGEDREMRLPGPKIPCPAIDGMMELVRKFPPVKDMFPGMDRESRWEATD